MDSLKTPHIITASQIRAMKSRAGLADPVLMPNSIDALLEQAAQLAAEVERQEDTDPPGSLQPEVSPASPGEVPAAASEEPDTQFDRAPEDEIHERAQEGSTVEEGDPTVEEMVSSAIEGVEADLGRVTEILQREEAAAAIASALHSTSLLDPFSSLSGPQQVSASPPSEPLSDEPAGSCTEEVDEENPQPDLESLPVEAEADQLPNEAAATETDSRHSRARLWNRTVGSLIAVLCSVAKTPVRLLVGVLIVLDLPFCWMGSRLKSVLGCISIATALIAGLVWLLLPRLLASQGPFSSPVP
jgi:hypothetical protein